MKNDRLFKIIYTLLDKKSVTACYLSEMLEVSVRTIYRDIDTLSASGVPIYAIQGKGGGISLMSGYALDKSLFTEDEQNQLLYAVQSLYAADPNISELLSKLGTLFKKSDTNWIQVDFSRWGFKTADNKLFEDFKKAILQKYIVEIIYFNSSGSKTIRNIKPFKLIFKSKNWYVQAFCLKSADFRLFKLSRISDTKLTDIKFTEDFSFAPPIEEDEVFYSNLIRLELKFTPKILFRVYEEFDINSLKILPCGSVTTCMTVPYDNWIFSYILSFGKDVEIISPKEFKDEFKKYVEEIYLHFIT